MIQQYKFNGRNIVLDVCSGSVHVVDDPTFDMISMFGTSDLGTIKKRIAEKYKNADGVTE